MCFEIYDPILGLVLHSCGVITGPAVLNSFSDKLYNITRLFCMVSVLFVSELNEEDFFVYEMIVQFICYFSSFFCLHSSEELPFVYPTVYICH